jgi:histidinol dehydrogenase
MNTTDNPSRKHWAVLTQRPTKKSKDLGKVIGEVFDEVKKNGDAALRTYTARFDNVVLKDLKVSQEEIDASAALVSEDLKNAIALAKHNIEVFHRSQITPKKVVETTPGVTCWQEMRAIEKVGLYIPGGTAPLFSTILMLGIPAV